MPRPTRFLLACLLLAAPLRAAGDPPSPEAFLGRSLADDGDLADWAEVSGYWRALAAASPRVVLDEIGRTAEGRPFLRAVISSEENVARLDEILRDNRLLSDPRGRGEEEIEALLRRAPVILGISLQMHSTEAGGSLFGMRLAHLLATSDESPWREARERVVTFVFPCTNPDGLDAVVAWHRRVVGTPFEASAMTRLYQKYAGHDNNRDWFLLSQPETRLVSRELYLRFRPQVWWDVHQQGRSRERLFVPPFRDPLDPNLDPALIAAIGAIGSRALLDLTAEGFTGVATGVTYDMWWNGGNRNVPVRHNVIGLLTEAASPRLASPVFLPFERLEPPRGLGDYAPSNRFPAPWPGGWWRLRDVVEYELAFARSLFAQLAREPRVWLETTLRAARRAVELPPDEAPKAFVLPAPVSDPGALRRLLSALADTGVEIAQAREPFTAAGRSFAAGSVVVELAQPYGRHVRDLFEVQRYPGDTPPYDVAGWTLPVLLGLDSAALPDPPPAPVLRPGVSVEEALGAMPPPPAPFGGRATTDSDAWRLVVERLRTGRPVRLAVSGAQAAFLFGDPSEADAAQGARLLDLAPAPRLGLYAPWSGSLGEGWMRHLLDRFGLPYRTLRPEGVRAGRLAADFDVVLVPDLPAATLERGRRPGTVHARFSGGLDPEGTIALDRFVRGGGRVVAVGRAAGWTADLFDLPLADVTQGDEAEGFSCPGSVLRALPCAGSPFTAGLGPDVPLFFAGDAGWRLPDDAPADVSVLLRYARRGLLVSGWMRRPEVLADRAAWVRARVDRGIVHLFAFRPEYRSWSQRASQLLLRALLLEEAR